MSDSQKILNLGLSVVLPVYNEEDSITEQVFDIRTFLKNQSIPYEIIIVNDGSIDSTRDIVADIQGKYPEEIALITHEHNYGYGISLRDGFKLARYSYIFFTDSDRQFKIESLGVLLKLMGTDEFDIIIGYRKNRQDIFIRRFLSWGYNVLANLLFNLDIKDIDCAFKIFKRDILNSIKIESRHFFINTEILAKAIICNYKILEVGVGHRPRAKGQSKVSIKHIPLTLKELILMYFRMRRFKKCRNL